MTKKQLFSVRLSIDLFGGLRYNICALAYTWRCRQNHSKEKRTELSCNNRRQQQQLQQQQQPSSKLLNSQMGMFTLN